jgi:hypothetical protein
MISLQQKLAFLQTGQQLDAFKACSTQGLNNNLNTPRAYKTADANGTIITQVIWLIRGFKHLWINFCAHVIVQGGEVSVL